MLNEIIQLSDINLSQFSLNSVFQIIRVSASFVELEDNISVWNTSDIG